MNNYGELKNTVADWLNREDLTDKIPRYVRLAEAEIYRDLRCDDNEFVARYTQTGWRIDGFPVQVTSPGLHVILPPNYVEMNQVLWNDRPLDQVSNRRLRERILRARDGEPWYYAIIDRKVQFSGAIADDPAEWTADSELVYQYYGTESLDSTPTWHVATNPVESPPVEDNTPQALSQTDQNTTRMFQMNPDLYLYGTCYHGSIHLRDEEGMRKWGALFKERLETMKEASFMRQVAGGTSEVTSAYTDNY